MSRKKARRNESTEHFARLTRRMMEMPAWQALPPSAQALYPWLKLEWHGPEANNNGKIRLSCRQAAARLGVDIKTAQRAFHALQAKGFLVVTEPAHLGVSGAARGPSYELTELATPYGASPSGRMLYRQWEKGRDFPVQINRANNPKGHNGKPKPHARNAHGNVVEMGTRKTTTSPKPG